MCFLLFFKTNQYELLANFVWLAIRVCFAKPNTEISLVFYLDFIVHLLKVMNNFVIFPLFIISIHLSFFASYEFSLIASSCR